MMTLTILLLAAMQAKAREPGNYSPPHPTTQEMMRAIKRCGGDPRSFTYHKGHQMLTLTGDEHLKPVDNCVAEYAQRFGVIPMDPFRIP